MIMNSLSTLITEINPCNKTWEICNGEKWKSEKETKQNRAGGKRYLQPLSMWKQQRRLYTNEWPRMVQVDWGGGRPKDIKFIWSPVEANIDEVPKVRGSTCLCNRNYVSMRGQGSHFSGLTKFPDFSLTFPVFFAIFPVFFWCFVFLTENLIHFGKCYTVHLNVTKNVK